jgi:phosphatidylserine decarboxylase
MTKLLSALFGELAKIERPRFLAKLIIFLFAKAFGIDFSNAVKKKFTSLYDMFTREIARDLSHLEPHNFIHPADGKLVSFGKVSDGHVFLVKGKEYKLEELVGAEEAKNNKSSYFYNYYLSPKDYHRVHHPIGGKFLKTYLIDGALYPVAGWFVKLCPDVFAKNARTVSIVESLAHGRVVTVMVGALNVGSLEMKRGLFDKESREPVAVGEHLGTFGLGSSVVVLTTKNLDVEIGKTMFSEVIG